MIEKVKNNLSQRNKRTKTETLNGITPTNFFIKHVDDGVKLRIEEASKRTKLLGSFERVKRPKKDLKREQPSNNTDRK